MKRSIMILMALIGVVIGAWGQDSDPSLGQGACPRDPQDTLAIAQDTLVVA